MPRTQGDPRTRTMKRCPRCATPKPLDQYAKATRRADGLQSHCKACGVIARRTTQRDSDLRRHFNITAEQYDDMLAAQGGACLICDTTTPGGIGRFHIDHDHACCPGAGSCGACVRGLLCSLCNTGLGMFKDDPVRLMDAAAYLIRNSDARMR